MQNEKIRQAEPKDLSDIMRLETQFGSDAFPAREFKKRFGSYLFKVLEIDSAIVGYYLVLTRKNTRSFRIYSICVDESWHGSGYGKALMRDIISQCGPRANIRLEVAWDNEIAKKLYASFGFKYTEVLSDYYGDGRNGVQMSLTT